MVAVAIVLPVIVTASFAILLAFALFEGDASERWARYLPTSSQKAPRDLSSITGRYKRLRQAMLQP